MQKRWNILSAEDAKLSELRQDLNIHPALLQILIQRRLDTYEKAKGFFQSRPRRPPQSLADEGYGQGRGPRTHSLQ